MSEITEKERLREINRNNRICVVLDKNDRRLCPEEVAGCVKIMDDCYPEGCKASTLFIMGESVNRKNSLKALMERHPGLYLVIVRGNDFQLIPSGNEFTPMLVKLLEMRYKDEECSGTWEFFDTYLDMLESMPKDTDA